MPKRTLALSTWRLYEHDDEISLNEYIQKQSYFQSITYWVVSDSLNEYHAETFGYDLKSKLKRGRASNIKSDNLYFFCLRKQ